MAEITETNFKWWLRDLLELGILVSVVAFMAVIYVPRSIWDEEEEFQDESRFRMENLYDVLSYFERLTGEKTDDPFFALSLVNAARDSLTADSTFLGTQKIILNGNDVDVRMYNGYAASYDTSFGFFRTRKDTLTDTVLTVVRFNEELALNDTSFVRLEEMASILRDTSIVGIPDTIISSHVELVNYYDSYMPDSTMLFCPLTYLPYLIDTGEDHLKVESPIVEPYVESRYAFFSLRSESHGKIEDGERSWARF